MTTIISPNIRKTSERIDTQGNIINPRTKQIIEPVVPEYVPPVIQPTDSESYPNPIVMKQEEKIGSKIDEMINRKIEELVAKKIEEALSKL